MDIRQFNVLQSTEYRQIANLIQQDINRCGATYWNDLWRLTRKIYVLHSDTVIPNQHQELSPRFAENDLIEKADTFYVVKGIGVVASKSVIDLLKAMGVELCWSGEAEPYFDSFEACFGSWKQNLNNQNERTEQ